jgi:hypothetical protein
MALTDYRKLCPKSGRALSGAERQALIAGGGAAGRARYMRCDSCGRTVEVCLDPGTGRAFLFSMHVREPAEAKARCGEGAA